MSNPLLQASDPLKDQVQHGRELSALLIASVNLFD
jgi:hypothetical protein